MKKGSKINKLVATPKRSGYTFKGWYTKKSGGKKISVNSKPTKSVTVYAQWKKGSSRVLTAAEKKLVGVWGISPTLPIKDVKEWIEFKKDGTFKYYISADDTYGLDKKRLNITGNYRVSSNKIYVSNQIVTEVYDFSPKSIDKSKCLILIGCINFLNPLIMIS